MPKIYRATHAWKGDDGMAYKDQLECPHCHMMIDIETEIEGDDGYMNLYPIVKPVEPKSPKETKFDELELERRLGN